MNSLFLVGTRSTASELLIREIADAVERVPTQICRSLEPDAVERVPTLWIAGNN